MEKPLIAVHLSLYSSVIFEKEEVTVDPLTLFRCLALVVETEPEIIIIIINVYFNMKIWHPHI